MSLQTLYASTSEAWRKIWGDFLQFAKACKRNLDKSVHHIIGLKADAGNSAALVKHIVGSTSTSEIAKKTGYSKAVVKNWTSNKTSPRLEEVFDLIHRFQFFLNEFIAAMIEVEKIPSLTGLNEKTLTQKNAIYQHPQIEPIYAALHLKGYLDLPQHVDGYLGKSVGISKQEERIALKVMEAVGIAENIDGKYYPLGGSIDTQGNFPGSLKLRKYWAQKYIEFLSEFSPKHSKSRTAYFVLDLSEEGEKKLLKAYYDFFISVKALYSSDRGPKKTVQLLSGQLIDLFEQSKLKDVQTDPDSRLSARNYPRNELKKLTSSKLGRSPRERAVAGREFKS